MMRPEGNVEVLVDIPGLTLVRVDGTMKVDVVPGFRSREESIAILSEFGDVTWPDEGQEADSPEAAGP